MASGKLKDLDNAPVYRMLPEQQVRLLSDALLREFMHRRGFLETLKTFDEENPRNTDTISSRALMSDLMGLDAKDQQRLKSQGIKTIMEMLCALRVEYRQEAEGLMKGMNPDILATPWEDELEQLRVLYRDKKKVLDGILRTKEWSFNQKSLIDKVLIKQKHPKSLSGQQEEEQKTHLPKFSHNSDESS